MLFLDWFMEYQQKMSFEIDQSLYGWNKGLTWEEYKKQKGLVFDDEIEVE